MLSDTSITMYLPGFSDQVKGIIGTVGIAGKVVMASVVRVVVVHADKHLI